MASPPTILTSNLIKKETMHYICKNITQGISYMADLLLMGLDIMTRTSLVALRKNCESKILLTMSAGENASEAQTSQNNWQEWERHGRNSICRSWEIKVRKNTFIERLEIDNYRSVDFDF